MYINTIYANTYARHTRAPFSNGLYSRNLQAENQEKQAFWHVLLDIPSSKVYGSDLTRKGLKRKQRNISMAEN